MQTLLAAVDAAGTSAAITSTNLADLRRPADLGGGQGPNHRRRPERLGGPGPDRPRDGERHSNIAWFEINPTTGDAFAVAEDGTMGRRKRPRICPVDDYLLNWKGERSGCGFLAG